MSIKAYDGLLIAQSLLWPFADCVRVICTLYSQVKDQIILLSDPMLQEEQAIDGSIMFSINAHK